MDKDIENVRKLYYKIYDLILKVSAILRINMKLMLYIISKAIEFNVKFDVIFCHLTDF